MLRHLRNVSLFQGPPDNYRVSKNNENTSSVGDWFLSNARSGRSLFERSPYEDKFISTDLTRTCVKNYLKVLDLII